MKYGLILLPALVLLSCHSTQSISTSEQPLPIPPREFRAAWVASVANINWPSRPGLSVSDQQTEAIHLLNLLRDHHYNAVILQVRPQCDALYESELEPWSYFLTGEQGEAPNPHYDPLQFWIEAAHQRGLELHAWLNPYRAHHTTGGGVTSQSIVAKKPDLAVRLKNGYWWLDPANPATQDHSFEVVMDIVQRYDVDGIHFDDYFYPYPSYNDGEEFPDSASWSIYQKSGGKLNRADWRREAVNKFIKRVYRGIKKEKAFVKFGLSPFGIWRPNHPPSIRGFDQYQQLYADAKLWLNKGWVDYWTPQLYWPIKQVPQSFPVLLNWWIQQNKQQRPIWPGLSIGRITGEAGIVEAINQIMITRGMLPSDTKGTVHWSIGPLVKSDSLVSAIKDGPYREMALVPPMHHLRKSTLSPPILTTSNSKDEFSLTWDTKHDVASWILHQRYGSKWRFEILSRNVKKITLAKTIPTENGSIDKLTNVAISFLDRNGQLSPNASVAPLR